MAIVWTDLKYTKAGSALSQLDQLLPIGPHA
jgi:hypothetical protein